MSKGKVATVMEGVEHSPGQSEGGQELGDSIELLLVWFLGRVSLHSPGWLHTHSVAQTNLELMIPVPQPLKC